MKGVGTLIVIFAAAVLLGMLIKYLGTDVSLLIMASICFNVGVAMIVFSDDEILKGENKE